MEPESVPVQKIDPKLRMIANGDLEVNTLRAERSDSIAITSDTEASLPEMTGMTFQPMVAFDLAALPSAEERAPLVEPPKEVLASVFIQIADNASEIPAVIRENAGNEPVVRRHNLVYAAVPLSKLAEIASDSEVIAIEKTEQVTFSPPLEVTPSTKAPPKGWLRAPGLTQGNGGEGVLIGIIDVQGFDFSHPDFLTKTGETRFVAIWDQGGTSHPGPEKFGYGSEITRDQMNAAFKATKKMGLPPTLLEPQSQMVPGSHGTHVASISAGNSGICPKADIAAVLISLPKEDDDRRKSFYDSSRVTHAVDYLLQLGTQLHKPVSINISLGTNGHGHDGSSITSRWIDYALSSPGRCVTVATGNAGQEKAIQTGDWGYMMGRIHNSGKVAQDGTADIEWVVMGNGISDLSENEMEIWYSPQDHFGIQIHPPDGEWTEIIEPGEFIENRELPSKNYLSLYNELYSPANGANYIACYLSPYLKASGPIGVKPGTWMIRLHGRTVRNGTYHAWIERDDPRRMGSQGLIQAWSFPSFLSEISNVDNSSVSSLACGQNIISVANLDEAKTRIHITSSQGPTRDGRQKPDLAAPGTDILAACGFSTDSKWVRMTGTSMAAPFVTGVVGQMLSARPDLTAAQVCAILCHTARPIVANSYIWANDAGFGVIDPAECLKEVQRSLDRKDRTK